MKLKICISEKIVKMMLKIVGEGDVDGADCEGLIFKNKPPLIVKVI